jgi:hypothetical protein
VDPDHRSAADPRTVEGLDARLLGDSGVMSAFRGRLSPP